MLRTDNAFIHLFAHLFCQSTSMHPMSAGTGTVLAGVARLTWVLPFWLPSYWEMDSEHTPKRLMK